MPAASATPISCIYRTSSRARRDPPYHADLAHRYPKAEFVVVTADDTAQMAQHLEWCDCYFDPLNALRPTYIPVHVPVLAFIHDLQHMHHPTFFSDTENAARLREYGYVFERADMLLGQFGIRAPQFRDLLRCRRGTRGAFERFHGRKSGRASYLDKVRAEKPADRPYLIYPAVPWVHKNHEILLQAIALLRQRGVDVPIMLTNVGGKKDRVQQLTALRASSTSSTWCGSNPSCPNRRCCIISFSALASFFPLSTKDSAFLSSMR